MTTYTIMTKEELINTVPKKARKGITDDIVDTLNSLVSDPNEAKIYKENIINYTNVLLEGRYKIQDYLNAVRFVGLVLGGMAKKQAYAKVFPDRHQHLIANGYSEEEYGIRVSMYQNSKLVKQIKEQAHIPLYILNMEHRQLAVNRLVEVLSDRDTSAKVTVEAADVLLKHLTPPQQISNGLNVVINTGDASSLIGELKETLDAIANQKRADIVINKGDVAHIANTTYLPLSGEQDE